MGIIEERKLQELQANNEMIKAQNIRLAKFRANAIMARHVIQVLQQQYRDSDVGRGLEMALEILDKNKIMTLIEAEKRGLDL